ncbi:MAG: FAD-binding protein [Acidiferrobacterales bacterium]
MLASYENKRQRLVQQLRAQDGDSVRLDKRTSNLFRDRKGLSGRRLDVSGLNEVLTVNRNELWAEAEGMTTYEDIVAATLRHGAMPCVVPELKSITIGGAVTGVGIESSSFKYGLVHEGITEMEILLASGEVVACSPTNDYKDLFFAFPNSYGTLGYALKLRFKLVPIKRYVQLTHTRYTDADNYFDGVHSACGQDIDFVDGTVFGPDELYVSTGKFVDDAPYTSDYTYENIYYQSIRQRELDYLTTVDYIWRWDTDWFWCSKHFFVQNPFVRALVGKSRLNSVTYTKIMRFNSKWNLTHRIDRLLGKRRESVIQDVDIPIERAPAFLEFFQREIGITPIWICPIRAPEASRRFDLYPIDPGTIYINFGFWDVKVGGKNLPEGYYNRQIEQKVRELGGIKSLYSDSYFSAEEFWLVYDKPLYDRLKAKYDPHGRFKNLYEKCVLRQ